jgi:hypothetical protein
MHDGARFAFTVSYGLPVCSLARDGYWPRIVRHASEPPLTRRSSVSNYLPGKSSQGRHVAAPMSVSYEARCDSSTVALPGEHIAHLMRPTSLLPTTTTRRSSERPAVLAVKDVWNAVCRVAGVSGKTSHSARHAMGNEGIKSLGIALHAGWIKLPSQESQPGRGRHEGKGAAGHLCGR